MPKQRFINVPLPLGGVHKRTSFASEPAQTLYDSRDVVPLDASTQRRRLSVRPGYSSVGSLNSANMFATLNVAPSETYKRLLMAAAGGHLYKWSGSAWTDTTLTGISTGRNVQAVGYLQKLYIANDSAAKVYDNTGTPSIADLNATAGDEPTACRLVNVWDGRLVWAGDPANPHVVNMSRQDDPLDYDYTEEDTGAAVQSTSLEGGNIGEPVTSVIPHNRECLLCGSANSIVVYRGNPRRGGTLERISHVTGPVNGTAWCKTSDDWLYFLSRDGLYRMPPGCGSAPLSVSREKIPNSLRGLDGVADVVYMEYDVLFRWIEIHVVGTNAQHWIFDLEGDGFWPITTPGASISAMMRSDLIESTTKSGVMVGTSSGVKRLDSTAALGGSDLAYATLNPVLISSGPGYQSQIREATTISSTNTTDTSATVTHYCGATAEIAAALPSDRSYPIALGKVNGKKTSFPMVGGTYDCIKYTQSSTSLHFSLEAQTLLLEAAGRER